MPKNRSVNAHRESCHPLPGGAALFFFVISVSLTMDDGKNPGGIAIFVAMKQTLLLISALFLLSGCCSKTAKPVAGDESVAPVDTLVSDVTPPEPSSDDEIVQNAIAKFLKGDNDAVRFTERAKRDLYESTWPEVHCSVEGMLDSPASFKNLVVKKVGPGLYKYECVCPDHGDRFVDFTTMSAHVARDGVVEIEGVKWMIQNQSRSLTCLVSQRGSTQNMVSNFQTA